MKQIETAAVPVIGETRETLLECPEHGKYQGWIMHIQGKPIESACERCLDAERQAEVQAIITASISNLKNSAFNNSCVPPRFQRKSIRDYRPHSQGTKQGWEAAIQYIKGFSSNNGASMLITGATGTGKTHLGCAVANNLMMLGHRAVYTDTLNFLSKIKRAWNKNSDLSEDELIESFVNFDLLVIDELGKGKLTETETGMIFRLINQRYEAKKSTIGLTNLTEGHLGKLLGTDTVRRLKEGSQGTVDLGTIPYTP
jgi:DNA replication protein DnaC